MDTVVETKEERAERRRREMTWGKHPLGEDRRAHDLLENLSLTPSQRMAQLTALIVGWHGANHEYDTRLQRAFGRIERRLR